MAKERRKRGGGSREDRKGLGEGFYEKVIRINRICKTVAGGRRLRFNALIVVGDRKGRVGIGLAKAQAVPLAIDKARRQAMSHMVTVPVVGTTIPDEVYVKFKAAKVLLRPVYRGRGIVAGETIRAIAEAAGISDLVTKIIGRSNPINVAKAVIIGLTQLNLVRTDETKRNRAT
ncbi:MAG: 30S ribosomal protein S5 [Candidatus Omnitrophota bacterium]